MSASYRLQFAEDMEDRLLDNPEAVEKSCGNKECLVRSKS